MSDLIVAFANLLMVAQQAESEIVLRHDIGTKYNRTDYESACESTVFRVRFRNGPEEHGRVDHLLINGQPVPSAAEVLQNRAARRVISNIEIMNCGADPKRPVLLGVMNLSKIESQGLGMRPSIFFRLAQQGREGWRLTVE